MIYLDSRTGSKELYVPLQSRGVPVELTVLEYGDAMFIGHGPAGDVLIGVERKVTQDLVSSLVSGRLSGHQIPGIVAMYPYRWIVVEGISRENKDGFLEVPRGGRVWESVGIRARAVEQYLLTVQLRGGVFVQRTSSLDGTAAWIEALYRWWTDKAWGEHRSHAAQYVPDTSDVGLWDKPGLVQRMAAQLPGIDTKARYVARRFKTPLEMAIADPAAWQGIKGIGKTIAARVVKALQEEGDGG